MFREQQRCQLGCRRVSKGRGIGEALCFLCIWKPFFSITHFSFKKLSFLNYRIEAQYGRQTELRKLCRMRKVYFPFLQALEIWGERIIERGIPYL